MDILGQEEKWSLAVEAAGNQAGGQEAECGLPAAILDIVSDGKTAVRLYRQEEAAGKVVCEVYTTASEEPLILTAENAAKVRSLRLVWLNYRIELWADGRLADEEWPAGSCLTRSGVWDARLICSEEMVRARLEKGAQKTAEEPGEIADIRYWAPEPGRHNVGDCMPFSDGDTFHLFYLKDRHQHKAKWGKGAHQFAHISTRDMVHWKQHPVAVEITHQWEGSICTGSVIRAKGKYYAFYAVRMMDGSGARLSWAVSDDCIHFTKSEQYFTLQPPYETVSARDPEVFAGADGRYHMLVTTDFEDAQVRERNGCLAHLVSDDLENWRQEKPFLVPGYTDQPECSDYFEWNGWYYLIFSNYGTAKYRYSRTPFGPWICPEQEILDGLLYRVPKTAAFGNRRIAAGFLCIHPEGESYAGNLILRELVQRADGTLGTCPVKELRWEESRLQETVMLESGESGGYAQKRLPISGNSVKIEAKPEESCGNYGLILQAGDKAAWEIRVDPGLDAVGIYPAHSNLYYCPSKKILTQMKGLAGGCLLEISLKGDILDLCVNGERTLICRLQKGYADGESVSWSGFVKDGKVLFA